MVFAMFLLSFLFFPVLSSLFFNFLVLTQLSLHFVFACFCFRPEKPAAKTLHPNSDGPHAGHPLR